MKKKVDAIKYFRNKALHVLGQVTYTSQLYRVIG